MSALSVNPRKHMSLTLSQPRKNEKKRKKTNSKNKDKKEVNQKLPNWPRVYSLT